jgi:hypothetical protein
LIRPPRTRSTADSVVDRLGTSPSGRGGRSCSSRRGWFFSVAVVGRVQPALQLSYPSRMSVSSRAGRARSPALSKREGHRMFAPLLPVMSVHAREGAQLDGLLAQLGDGVCTSTPPPTELTSCRLSKRPSSLRRADGGRHGVLRRGSRSRDQSTGAITPNRFGDQDSSGLHPPRDRERSRGSRSSRRGLWGQAAHVVIAQAVEHQRG